MLAGNEFNEYVTEVNIIYGLIVMYSTTQINIILSEIKKGQYQICMCKYQSNAQLLRELVGFNSTLLTICFIAI